MNEVTCYKKDGRIYFRKKDIPYKRYVMKRMGRFPILAEDLTLQSH